METDTNHDAIQTRLGTLSVLFLITFLSLVVSACQAELSDTEISDAIHREFIYDQAVLAGEVTAETEDGIVTLRGTTENLLAKEWAARVAETVKGVRSVVNLIEVDPQVSKTDEEIHDDVEQALYRDPAADSYELSISVQDGSVELTGTVQSLAERDLAEKVVKQVRGVTEVNNQIVVEPAQTRPELEVKQEIEGALRWDALVDHSRIEVRVVEGTVYLQGAVGSAAEKRRARFDATVPGIDTVDDSQLLVQGWARDEELRVGKYTDVSDEEVANALTAAVQRDPRLTAASISVTVNDGEATLEGSVPSVKAWRTAVELARHTVGVDQVINRLTVEPIAAVPDSQIVAEVRTALQENAIVDAAAIGVTVSDGVVTLDGVVDSSVEKVYADDVASGVRGVMAVENELTIAQDAAPLFYDPYVWKFDPRGFSGYRTEPYTTDIPDQAIQEAVERELFWSPFVDEEEILVSVADGVVTLHGTVESLRERADAIENAYEGGAAWVEDELTVMN